MEKTILVYGDSNTWGWDAQTAVATGGKPARFARGKRFCGILQERLAPEATLIEEGLPGRTTVLPDPLGEHKNGRDYLLPCLLSHAPLDLVVLFLGTNDRQLCYQFPPAFSAEAVGEYVDIIRSCECGRDTCPEILILSAPAPGQGLEKSPFAPFFPVGRLAGELRELNARYKEKAQQRGCHFFDVFSMIQGGMADSIHMDETSHALLAQELEKVIRHILFC